MNNRSNPYEMRYGKSIASNDFNLIPAAAETLGWSHVGHTVFSIILNFVFLNWVKV